MLARRNAHKGFKAFLASGAALLAIVMVAGCGGSGGGGGTPAVSTNTVAEKLGVHGCYGKDGSPSGFDHLVAANCNVIDRAAFPQYLDQLPPGVKGMVWVGNYDNSVCDFQKSDDWIRSHVAAIAGHPGIATYFIADIPHFWDCPTAPDQMRARSALIHSIDPGPPTLVAIEPSTGPIKGANPFTPYVGTVDIIGAERYPCTFKDGCVMSRIDDTIALLQQANVPRYWAILQAFADSTHLLPTPDELRAQVDHWRGSRMEGLLWFSWSFGTEPLDNHPDLVQVIAEENAS